MVVASMRDVVVQLKPSEAEFIQRALRTTQDVLESASEFFPSTREVVAERAQEISKLRGLMHRIRDAPLTTEYVPHEVGGVVLLRVDNGKVVCWGPNMEQITGWSGTEMRGEPAWQVMGVPDTRATAFMERMAAERVVQRETEIPTKWGRKTRVFYRAEVCDDQAPDNHADEFILIHVWPV